MDFKSIFILNKILRYFFIFITITFAFTQTGVFTDKRDGQSYEWVKIGNQIWMAENLKYKSRGSGYYDLNLYGRLYNWKKAKKACPKGWHLPSDDEWTTLERNTGGENAGKNLKSKTGWKFYIQAGNGIDLYGFGGLPGGYYQFHNKRYMYYGSGITFWTSTASNYPDVGESAITRELNSHLDGIDSGEMYVVHGGYCRCIKDP
jgi:uncharacterized protein (TIGR02145 family)